MFNSHQDFKLCAVFIYLNTIKNTQLFNYCYTKEKKIIHKNIPQIKLITVITYFPIWQLTSCVLTAALIPCSGLAMISSMEEIGELSPK